LTKHRHRGGEINLFQVQNRKRESTTQWAKSNGKVKNIKGQSQKNESQYSNNQKVKFKNQRANQTITG